jgi:hypothetical protein
VCNWCADWTVWVSRGCCGWKKSWVGLLLLILLIFLFTQVAMDDFVTGTWRLGQGLMLVFAIVLLPRLRPQCTREGQLLKCSVRAKMGLSAYPGH